MISCQMLIALILFANAGCAGQPENLDLATAPQLPTTHSVNPASTCTPTDQDAFVWQPVRLKLVQPCTMAAGTVMEIAGPEPDGDIHIHIRPDPLYQALLTPGSRSVNNYLVLEAVCQYIPPMIEALRVCASDPDPYLGPFPQIGDHIWAEGRYVLDLAHGAWAELHPLYRWGIIKP